MTKMAERLVGQRHALWRGHLLFLLMAERSCHSRQHNSSRTPSLQPTVRKLLVLINDILICELVVIRAIQAYPL